jgi:hypothetical protein
MKTTRMKSRRFWIEILVSVLATAAALALLLASPAAVAPVAGEPKALLAAIQEAPPQTQAAHSHQTAQHAYTGMVTCSQCGARHPAASAKTAADCTRTCVRSGAQFTLVAGERTYLLNGDVAPLKTLAGQRARIVGAMSGNTITISSAVAAI